MYSLYISIILGHLSECFGYLISSLLINNVGTLWTTQKVTNWCQLLRTTILSDCLLYSHCSSNQ